MSNSEDETAYETLRRKIKNLSIYAWERRIVGSDIDEWLNNFETSEDDLCCERLQMLHLLGQFMYFGGKEMRELMKSVYRDKYRYKIVEGIRKNNNDTLDIDFINDEFDKALYATRFMGIGNPSESSTHLLYYFRQENALPKSLFINGHEVTKRENGVVKIRDEAIINYVFVDDLCGSGEQACDYSDEIVDVIKSLNPDAIVSYYALFAMSDGISKVKNESQFDYVDCVYELDDSFKCFSEESRHYKEVMSPIDKEYAEKISQKYGGLLLPSYPLGYGGCQLLIGFYHNTPDNTLPIIWYDEKTDHAWTPIFRRYSKNYS